MEKTKIEKNVILTSGTPGTHTVILISGTPGTGKTEVAKIIAKELDYEYCHIGDNEEYITEKTDVKIIDIEKMNTWIEKESETKKIIIDSHLAHYYPAELTKACIILRCDPAELKNRLKKREYPEEKIMINLEAEVINLITQEAVRDGHRAYEIDTTTKTASQTAIEAINAINKELEKHGEIDYTYYIKNLKYSNKKPLNS
ncbi:MAG TPA: adenylate kinase family protein [Candidatus Nanoarchaeia archaeon]|nr:adenylate kinase family protein [Candidatus Nanoarchaeia archaeon]